MLRAVDRQRTIPDSVRLHRKRGKSALFLFCPFVSFRQKYI